MDALLNILAYGDDAAVTSTVYDAESLTDAAIQIPLALLRTLRAPEPGLRLEVVERHQSGRFELLILRLPWKTNPREPGSGLHPLLIADQAGTPRAVGFVLPWNEIVQSLESELNSVTSLSVMWIQRLAALRAAPPL